MSTMMFFLSGFMSVAAVDIDEDHLTKTVTSCSGKPVNDERANCCFSRCRDKYTGRNLRGEKIICRMRCKCEVNGAFDKDECKAIAECAGCKASEWRQCRIDLMEKGSVKPKGGKRFVLWRR